MKVVEIHDFSIRDLIKPDHQRVKNILSAVINFAKFREEQMPVFDKYTERSVRLLRCNAYIRNLTRLVIGNS